MTKRKYCKGVLVVNIAELSNYDGFLYFNNKITHAGWWQSYQYSYLKRAIKRGIVYYAEFIGDINGNKKD